ncbi:hypothetical protein EVAR_15655_1 [Eumeta japonica]|uniref:Uncharacterized protein n=1 Tax=Eumeta variegata TaxID=151549 RepID=A0A4C1U9E3_EUMVA|nr:hypothetical protein EVAR_15655_1 [Eumeta japonica]
MTTLLTPAIAAVILLRIEKTTRSPILRRVLQYAVPQLFNENSAPVATMSYRRSMEASRREFTSTYRTASGRPPLRSQYSPVSAKLGTALVASGCNSTGSSRSGDERIMNFDAAKEYANP